MIERRLMALNYDRQVRVRAAQYPSSAFLGGAPMGAPPRSIGGQRGTSIHLQTWALITSVHPSMRAFCFADGVVSWRKWGQTTCTVPFLSFADALDIAHGQDEAGNGGSAPPSPRSVDSETRDGSSDPTGPGAQLRRRVFHAARQALQLVQHQLQSAYIAARGHADCGQRAFELLELHFVLQANGFPCLVDVCSPVRELSWRQSRICAHFIMFHCILARIFTRFAVVLFFQVHGSL